MDPLAFSPDSRLLAAAYPRPGSEIVLRSTETAETVAVGQSPSRVTALAFEPSGQHLVSGHLDGTVCLWKIPEAQIAARIDINHEVFALDVSRHGIVAATAPDGSLTLLDLQARERIDLRPGRDDLGGEWVKFLKDGATLVTAGRTWDQRLTVWDVLSRKIRSRLDGLAPFGLAGQAGWVAAPAVHSATHHPLREVNLWSLKTFTVIGTLPPPPAAEGSWWLYNHMAATPDGRLLAQIAENGQLFLWNVRDSVPMLAWGETDPAIYVTCSSDSRHVAAGSLRERLWTLDLEHGRSPRAHERPPTSTLPMAVEAFIEPTVLPVRQALPPRASVKVHSTTPEFDSPTLDALKAAPSAAPIPVWMRLLEEAFADRWLWAGWSSPEKDVIDLAFTSGPQAGSRVFCIRLAGHISTSFLSVQNFPSDWPQQMRQGKLKPLPLLRGWFSMTDTAVQERILAEATQVEVAAGTDSRLPGVRRGDVTLSLWSPPVGLVVSADRMHPYDNRAWLEPEDVIKRIAEWHSNG